MLELIPGVTVMTQKQWGGGRTKKSESLIRQFLLPKMKPSEKTAVTSRTAFPPDF